MPSNLLKGGFPQQPPQQFPQKELESSEIKKWKAPTLEELKERKNGFRENRADILGLLKMLLLERIATGSVSPIDAKDFFQSMLLSDHGIFLYEDDISALRSEMFQDLNKIKKSQEELLRSKSAREFSLSVPSTNNAESDSEGFFLAPKFITKGRGIFFTNIYRNPKNENGKLMNLEDLDYRVNIACSYELSERRVQMDLFQLLNENPILAQKGFKIKSLGGNRTDAVIIYCGKEGVSAATEEAVNYLNIENISPYEHGVPLGVNPLDENGYEISRISITSSPHGDHTFNSLQATVLLDAFKETVNKFLATNVGSEYNFENAKPDDLLRLLPEIKKRDTYLFVEIEKEYEIALKKHCGAENVDMHNLAFPFIKNCMKS